MQFVITWMVLLDGPESMLPWKFHRVLQEWPRTSRLLYSVLSKKVSRTSSAIREVSGPEYELTVTRKKSHWRSVTVVAEFPEANANRTAHYLLNLALASRACKSE